jgi:phenol 2-monooxygenase
LLIPREGGHLVRLYVDLGEVAKDDNRQVRQTTLESTIAKANQILHPYTVDVKDCAWHTVYEVGHRVTDKFDDVAPGEEGSRSPRVFITGDACHTHSAKAGQGMNVSMQDAWKLGHVLSGIAPKSLLDTYSSERQVVAQNLIDFDREWSSLMAKPAEEFENPQELADFYLKTAEFPAGFMTEYQTSIITGTTEHQNLATGFPVGKRFKSAFVTRVCDGNKVHLGHHATADGRWRIYAFADSARPGADSRLAAWAEWMLNSPDSPVVKFTPEGSGLDSLFDIKVIYQQPHSEVEFGPFVPAIFAPKVGPFQLTNYEKVYATDPSANIFAERGIDTEGAVVVVRPDHYVSQVLSLTDVEEIATFFNGALIRRAR